MGNKRFEEIDIIKGFAIVMVLLGHAVIRYPVNLHDIPSTKVIYDWVETTHMPLFFFVSGYCYSIREGREGFSTYLYKKIRRILIPYTIYNIIDIIPRFFLPSLVNRPRSITESIIEILLYGGEYWFLYSLFLVFLLFPIVDKCIRNNLMAQVLFLIACVFLKFVPWLPSVFLIKRTAYHLLYFGAGYVLRKHLSFESIRTKIITNKLVSLSVMIVCLLSITLVLPTYVDEYNQLIGIPLSFCGIISFHIISIILPWKKIRKMFAEFGRYSLQLYLLNGFILVFSRLVIVKLLHCTTPILIVLFNLICTVVLGYLISKYILERSKYLRMISGFI